jgi:hypothetical protein
MEPERAPLLQRLEPNATTSLMNTLGDVRVHTISLSSIIVMPGFR